MKSQSQTEDMACASCVKTALEWMVHMFGYVMINKPELKIKDYERYQSYYCGLCRTLKQRYGRKGQATLTYDMTFLALFLTALYEPKTKKGQERCLLHPFRKHTYRVNRFTKYAADMNILMTYYKFLDDWKDEKSIKGLAGSRIFKKRMKKIEKKYIRQSQAVKKALEKLSDCEKRNEKSVDAAARCFGELMEELFVYKKDEWERSLRRIGFFLGKFIYLLDAYDDLERDKKTGGYNPFSWISNDSDYDEKSKEILTFMMAECAREFEKLPILEEADILRNIMYSGVWMRYLQVNKEKETVKKKSGME